jgi:hypothetical protein
MGVGLDAVKAEIMSEFDVTALTEHLDVDTMSTDLGFAAEGHNFVVRVSLEFDQDYEHGLPVDLGQLGMVLRASEDGKATIRR